MPRWQARKVLFHLEEWGHGMGLYEDIDSKRYAEGRGREFIKAVKDAKTSAAIGNNGAVKNDKDKLRMDLIYPGALTGLAEVLSYGAKKYGDRNWEEGMEWGRIYGATIRHLNAWWSGEEEDPETDLSHLKHAMCNIMFLLAYEEFELGDDNRGDLNG